MTRRRHVRVRLLNCGLFRDTRDVCTWIAKIRIGIAKSKETIDKQLQLHAFKGFFFFIIVVSSFFLGGGVLAANPRLGSLKLRVRGRRAPTFKASGAWLCCQLL